MLGYYLKLGVRNLRRNPVMTFLMILTLAIGVAASVSTLTILYVMSGDPIPHKSDRLIVPVLDNGPLRDYTPGQPPNFPFMAYRDAVNLLASKQGVRRTVLYDVGGAIEPARRDLPVINTDGIATTSDYFAMFEVPFLHGGAWSAADDQRAARVAVLSRKHSEKVFGKDNPVGRSVRVFSQDYTVIGVLDHWQPTPRYTHLVNGSGGSAFDGEETIYIPFTAAIAQQQESNGSTNCSGDAGVGYQGLLDSECTWIQPWVELASAGDKDELRGWLDAYLGEQRKLGRFPRPEPARVYDVMEWMDFLEVVDNDNRLAVWLAFGFLMLCLFNTMGLLLAKFSVRSPEVGVRRALGATRSAIFRQFLVESGVVGLMGGALGLVLSLLCLWLIGKASAELSVVARMDWTMLGFTLLLAIGAAILAGLLPTWRACNVTPAVQLKSQ
ncbi:MAG TPA: ABC transporter permease [Rubrivivax sp.]|nr:ABC transporter permease [Rubrivivax sp.]